LNAIRLLLASAAILAAGCATDINPNAYMPGAVGQVNRTVAGVVISARTVSVLSEGGAGGAVGAGAGAVAGSSLGGGGRANALGAIGGAVVGGVIGAAAQRSSSQQPAAEYVVQTENGSLLTVVQGATPAFIEGSRVLVLYGSPSRVIADPRSTLRP
jgi:outer membrane lipoprotein SlyB